MKAKVRKGTTRKGNRNESYNKMDMGNKEGKEIKPVKGKKTKLNIRRGNTRKERKRKFNAYKGKEKGTYTQGQK